MYSRVKRPRMKVKRDMYGVPINSSESDNSSSGELLSFYIIFCSLELSVIAYQLIFNIK